MEQEESWESWIMEGCRHSSTQTNAEAETETKQTCLEAENVRDCQNFVGKSLVPASFIYLLICSVLVCLMSGLALLKG